MGVRALWRLVFKAEKSALCDVIWTPTGDSFNPDHGVQTLEQVDIDALKAIRSAVGVEHEQVRRAVVSGHEVPEPDFSWAAEGAG